MKEKADLIAILNRLVSVECNGDPTLIAILRAVPNLQRLDWINRFGPAGAWSEVTSEFKTNELERLVKIIVVAEREFEWLGGSVAAAIWLFRSYRDRPDGDADALGDWALKNRGRNDYIPFGRMTSVGSVAEWHVEQRSREEWRELQRQRILAEKDAKARRKEEAAERSLCRKEASRVRHMELQPIVERLRTLGPSERLSYIATKAALPLEFIPQNLIAECIPVAACLDDETKQLLAGRIGRRRSKVWKSLWIALA